MPVEIAGFAQALARCQSFDSIDTAELEKALAAGKRPLEMHFVEPSADVAFIQSGQPFSHLYFVQHGMMVPWQYPHSELSSPFLIGEHEFVMGADRWVAPYSAAEETTVIGIPKEAMQLICDRLPVVRDQMNRVLMRRISRYYWTSLATSGNPASRVAAALISRLALEQDDFGTKKEISILQRDLVRLTVMSRSAVAAGVAMLATNKVIGIGSDPSERFRGIVRIPNVDRLKQAALEDVRGKRGSPAYRAVSRLTEPTVSPQGSLILVILVRSPTLTTPPPTQTRAQFAVSNGIANTCLHRLHFHLQGHPADDVQIILTSTVTGRGRPASHRSQPTRGC